MSNRSSCHARAFALSSTTLCSWRGQLGRNLASVRLLACPSSPRSAAARNWYAGAYMEIKALNPRFPFLLRAVADPGDAAVGGAGATATTAGNLPRLFVEYDFGAKVAIDLAGLTEEQIDSKLREAVLAGDSMPRAFHQSQAPLRLPTVVD